MAKAEALEMYGQLSLKLFTELNFFLSVGMEPFDHEVRSVWLLVTTVEQLKAEAAASMNGTVSVPVLIFNLI